MKKFKTENETLRKLRTFRNFSFRSSTEPLLFEAFWQPFDYKLSYAKHHDFLNLLSQWKMNQRNFINFQSCTLKPKSIEVTTQEIQEMSLYWAEWSIRNMSILIQKFRQLNKSLHYDNDLSKHVPMVIYFSCFDLRIIYCMCMNINLSFLVGGYF